MNKYEIVINNNATSSRAAFRVHKEGCRDIPMECRRLLTTSFTIEGNNAQDAVNNQIKSFEEEGVEYKKGAFELAPCLKGKK